jgi:hypothetical protein
MNICSSVFLSTLVLFSQGPLASAQGKDKPKKPASAPTPAAKPAAKPAPKESLEARFARQNLKEVLDAVDAAWFGKPYQNATSVELQGSLAITLSAAAMNAKAEQLGQGVVKGGLTKNGQVDVHLKSIYFANADFRTEFSGEFGNLLYYRAGNRGFLYSKDQNAFTTKVDSAPADAPLTFLAWFRQCINDVQAVYVDGSTFKATLGKELNAGGASLQTLSFVSPTTAYDPKKREQSLAESLGFWKRGKLEVVFDKATKLPQQMNYSNDSQGVNSRMTFSYLPGGKLSSVNITNQSKGMEGPASLALGYGGDGLINHLAGEMGFAQGKMRFDLDLSWSKTRKLSDIRTIPPLGATRKGREEMETLLLVNLASKVLDLQRSGFNLRSVTLTNK